MDVAVRIAEAAKDDLQSVAHLHTRSQSDAYADFLPPGAADDFDPDMACAHWVSRMALPGTRQLLVARSATDTSEVVGFGLVTRETAPWATINALHVRPDLKGAGIGTLLIDALLETARHWDRTGVYLYVVTGNRDARAFYAHRGWQPAGPGPDHAIAGHPVTTCRYDRSL